MTTIGPYEELPLLLKISQGDQVAFKKLFEQYRNQLFTYLLKITKSAESSEEIVLDVFMKIWNNKESLTQIENFNNFLYRIAHNKAIDFLRSVKNDPAIQHEIWALIGEEQVSAEDADKNLLLKNAEATIEEAIAKLSPQRQKVFYLHHYQGFSNEEIAEKLNLSKNTVRNHLFASLEFIRRYISVYPGLFIILLF